MLSVGQVLKTLSTESDPQTPAAAFTNWLCGFCDPSEFLAPDLINSFFQDCLQFPHWQQNAKPLSEQIRRILENLCLQLDEIFEFDLVLWPQNLQWIEVQNNADWSQVLEQYFKDQGTGGSEKGARLVFDPYLQKMIALNLQEDGSLLLQEFGRQFIIQNGRLQPLRSDLVIAFDSSLDLKSEFTHKLDCGNFMTARFHLEESHGQLLALGAISRGFDFALYQELNGVSIEDNAKVFYTLKRLEQQFLKKESNPFYCATISSVEHILKMLQLKDESALQRAPQTLSFAQNALDYVFIGDKLLNLLIRDLQHTMSPLLATANSSSAKGDRLDSPRSLSARTAELKRKLSLDI
jgi:hypothetical protein